MSDALPAPVDDFDPVWYLQTYPDVRAAGLDPWQHFDQLGRAEGRLGAPVQALELDHMLWRGYADIALPALRQQLTEGSPQEAAAAGWVLARWERDQGNFQAAYEAILQFHADPAARWAPGHPGPYLLAVQLCLHAADVGRAEQILAAGCERFGRLPDFDLAQLLCKRARGADEWEIETCLARLYAPAGLAALQLRPDGGCRFDRLETASPIAAPSLSDLGAAALSDWPLVSVIVPVFNGCSGAGGGLARALQGLSAQSWPNLEILVVDDGSVDDSAAVAAAHGVADPRCRVISLPYNQGAYPARNVGMAAARGDFITVHDADDWSHPQKIEQQVLPLLANPELQATVSHWLRADNDLNMTRWRIEERWIHRNVSSLMLRAGLRDSLGYWDRLRVNADTEYYYRLLHVYGPDALAEVCPGVPLAFGRTEAGSLTLETQTHLRTQFKGLRRAHMEAAHYWHDHAESLYLPQYPAERPFRVPAEIGLGDPEPAPSDYDLICASPLFDADWYRLSHGDVLRADMSPARHFLQGGAQENRDPGPLFSSGGYRRAQGLAPQDNPLLHYETIGRACGADPLPSFAGSLTPDTPDTPHTLVFAHTSGKTLFGAERSLIGVVTRMARQGRNPVVVLPTLRNSNYLDRLLACSVAVEVLPQLWRHRLRQPGAETLAAIRGLIRKHRATEVHVNTVVLDAPLIAARAEAVESVVHVRELPAEDMALRRNLGDSAAGLHRSLLAQADRFVVTARPVADWLGCPDRVVIRPNSVDAALFDLPFAPEQQPEQQLRVALISSNIAKKGLADFLEVARIAAAEDRPIRFLLIGPPSQDLHLLRPWPENVDFRGYAADPVQALAEADIVMSLSKFAESFGRTVMEAMAAGRPVICYDRGTPPTLLRSGQEGLVVPADDPQAAANAVLALEAARGQLLRMSRAARQAGWQLQQQALAP